MPKNDTWKKKYKEPGPPDLFNLPNIPPGWVWARLNAITDITSSGKFGVTSPSVELNAAQVSLGVGASGYLINGTKFTPALSSMLTTSVTQFTNMATVCIGPLAPLASGFTGLAASFTALNLQLISFLSTVTRTV